MLATLTLFATLASSHEGSHPRAPIMLVLLTAGKLKLRLSRQSNDGLLNQLRS